MDYSLSAPSSTIGTELMKSPLEIFHLEGRGQMYFLLIEYPLNGNKIIPIAIESVSATMHVVLLALLHAR